MFTMLEIFSLAFALESLALLDIFLEGGKIGNMALIGWT